MKAQRPWYIPVTPGGTPLVWGAGSRLGQLNAARTEAEAWKHLLEDAAHMPYRSKEAFVKRGYTVECWEEWNP